MEKVFVHPECPFSENTFNLLTDFYENPSSDFYIAHKKDFLKYVEEPVNYILSQVEEQLPDFIKKYIESKHEGFSPFKTKDGKSPNLYSGKYSLIGRESSPYAKLILNIENHTLTFGLALYTKPLYTKPPIFILSSTLYKTFYRNNVNFIKIIKGYNLPKKHHFYLDTYTNQRDYENEVNCNRIITKPEKGIYELLESMLLLQKEMIDTKTCEVLEFSNIQVGLSLDSEEILRASAKHLIKKIAQTFKKVFPLFLFFCFFSSAKDVPLLLRQYLSVYEKEFNPVYELEEISETTGFQTTQLAQWIHTINRKGQTIIQGPPGTGKTFLAQKIAQYLIGGGDGFSDTIQFHPAYTYEDFIQGIRPQSQDGQLTYPIVPGRFLEFCEKAEACEDICVLIIDEINRANLSQVLGELMYLLDDRQDTKRFITLASGQKFRIPTNVRIIGTMNTADRSIALVDNALRRRFAFISISPNYELLQKYHIREKTGFAVDQLIGILENVNRAIKNKHYELGISFFLTKTLAGDIQDIWQMEIEPYLEEYFFDDQAKMDEFLWDKIKDKLSD